MDSDIPVIVRRHVECATCGHTEDETYERSPSPPDTRSWYAVNGSVDIRREERPAHV